MKTPAKLLIMAALAVAVAGAVALKKSHSPNEQTAASDQKAEGATTAVTAVAPPGAKLGIPRLVDVGAGKCIPCKLMAPILEDLKKELAGHLQVDFVDVWVNPEAGEPYKIQTIPTQIFYDGNGKELFRHEGFFGKEDILGKWKELGVDLSGGKPSVALVRETPVAADTRPRETVCFMCDEAVNGKSKTVVKGQSEQRILCSPHCYFIYLSSLVGADPKVEEAKVSVTDWAGGNLVAATAANYLYGMDAKGRATIKAFADKDAATKEQQSNPGNLVSWDVLRSKELATRCAFCDRAVYPEDACGVKFGTTHGYGCCTHCSMGVAARLKQDIEVEAKDGLTGEAIHVRTLDGQIASPGT